ncbi:hypothetical protein [Streptomyces sp. NBC_00005]|uniref:hypothetical protein n=1 Tax=Streptomyces sp. NBC_00005 TaxID=2903609 RepID=UPI00324D42DE
MSTARAATDDAHSLDGVRSDFTWFDNERVIRFGRDALRNVESLFRDHGFGRYALLTTERAAA